MFNVSSEDFQKYARIVIYTIGGMMINHGFVNSNVWAEWSGPLLIAVNFGWTLYGNRIIAKLNEISKVPGTVIVTKPELANAMPDNNNVVSNTDVKVTTK